MDFLSFGGLLLALVAVFLGQYLEGGQIAALVNVPALIIVVGGTLGATMVQSPRPVFVRAMRMCAWLFRPPPQRLRASMKELIDWARVVRSEGLLGLENALRGVKDAHTRKGLQLLIDGNEPDVIRETLLMDCAAREQRDLAAAKVLDGMGGYAPTLGILGAVMGLIHVMNNLADPAELGGGIAVAFVATIYGVAFANLLFIPAAAKLKALVRAQSRAEEIIVIGIVAIAHGEHPRVVESRLQSLVGMIDSLYARQRGELADDDERLDRWVLSYADFITLLFAFFVVMYSISSVNDGKLRVLSDSMQEIFSEQLPEHLIPIDFGGGMPLSDRIGIEELDGSPLPGIAPPGSPAVDDVDGPDLTLEQRLNSKLKPLLAPEDFKVRSNEHWLTVELPSEFLFDSGRARLQPGAAPVLQAIAGLLAGVETPIRVEGFTDNVPISGERFSSNWQLSAARAAAVVEFLTQGPAGQDLDPAQIAAVGYGEHHPVADNASADGRRENRRVVIAAARRKDVISDTPAAVAVTETPDEAAAAEEVALGALRRVTRLPAAIGFD